MTNPQPHIKELGAFDPVVAWTQIGQAFVHLVEGLRLAPKALPDDEVMHAVEIAMDTLEVITEATCTSLLSMLMPHIDPEVWTAHRDAYYEARHARSPEEQYQYELELLGAVSQFIPHEMTLPPFGEDDDTDSPNAE